MQSASLSWLELLQIADSSLPIGSLAHSFGLESLIADGKLTVNQLSSFLSDYLAESGMLDATCCLRAHALAELSTETFETHWPTLNDQIDALKLARESREASAALGRRFLQLAVNLEPAPHLLQALEIGRSHASRISHSHHSASFGLVCGAWEINRELAACSFLQQSVAALISACQRLLPLGQTQASQILWAVKPTIIEVTHHAIALIDSVPASEPDSLNFPSVFMPTVEIASMRHPGLATRLFIS